MIQKSLHTYAVFKNITYITHLSLFTSVTLLFKYKRNVNVVLNYHLLILTSKYNTCE